MPKVAVRPLRSSFPHASPVSTSGAGKQEAAPEDRFKPLISSRKFGAGEGIRNLDPNLGKVVPKGCFWLLGFARLWKSTEIPVPFDCVPLPQFAMVCARLVARW